MMAIQSYHGGGEHDALHRPTLRAMNPNAYYDRIPYSYYKPRGDSSSDHNARHSVHTTIHNTDCEAPSSQSRRRIAVACSRCRRRKIKCSGDIGDNAGCQACRNAGAQAQCAFMRIGAQPLSSIEMISGSATWSIDDEAQQGGIVYSRRQHTLPLHTRASLPTLNTMGSYQSDYDINHNQAKADTYSYGSSAFPRRDSSVGAYSSADASRNYSVAAPYSAPTMSSIDQYNTHPLNGLHVSAAPQTPSSPCSQTTSDRLPSATADAMSALNMGSLHSTLPSHTAQERRLPVPYTIQYPRHPLQSQSLPEVCDFDLASFRPHINGVHSRTAMPWTSERRIPSSTLSYPAQARYASGTSAAQNSRTQSTASIALNEPVLGYQFQQANAYGQDESSGPGLAGLENYTNNTSDLSLRRNDFGQGSSFPVAAPLPAISSTGQSTQRPTSHEEAATSLYSFSTEASEQARQDIVPSNRVPGEQPMYVRPESAYHRPSVDQGSRGNAHLEQSQYQPHHTSEYETLRSQASFEQQQQQSQRQARPGHRASSSSLTLRY